MKTGSVFKNVFLKDSNNTKEKNVRFCQLLMSSQIKA